MKVNDFQFKSDILMLLYTLSEVYHRFVSFLFFWNKKNLNTIFYLYFDIKPQLELS